ncbi:uncharacterized protein DNG_05699 [Cephalotrichum gorgonifer]|uniref:Hemerythrin-like domain-containing protein n=1 Tax=Cephalotrichum gorgonifer TaxID=2041049 RepID=A0AAE8N0B5_9PEZI|nr:uncharacterized protein DNG_05699 [Cephalotrichum gorgonifer]
MSSSSTTKQAAALGMSLEDFTQYNHLAVLMEAFHSRLRDQFMVLRKAATTRALPRGYSSRAFIDGGLRFCQSLAMHHAIEEEYVFKDLAVKMPQFRRPEDGGTAPELLAQHDVMHDGLERLSGYLRRCKSGQEELDWGELEASLGWGDVLLAHLDAEVETLGAASMSKYWTLEEMDGFRRY